MSYISVYESDLAYEASQGVITQKQAAQLWQQLSDRDANRWRLGWVRLAYAIGAFLIIGSMTWFTSIVWYQNTLGLFFLASSYVAVFGYAGVTFWNPNSWNVPQIVGGIFTLISVLIVPVAVFGLEKFYRYDPPNYPGVFLAGSLVIASSVALYYVPWPFLTAPLSAALYFLAEADLAPFIYDEPIYKLSRSQIDWVSVGFGTVFLSCNILVDRMKGKQDFAFWGYIYGLLAFSGGLTDLFFGEYQHSETYKLVYGGINLGLLALAVLLQRNAFLVFGGLGISIDFVDYLVTESTVEINSWVSISFGALLIGASYVIANKDPSQEFPFWGYLTGVWFYWAGWTTLFAWPIYKGYYFAAVYFANNVGLLAASVYTKQRVFLIFGSFGVFWYIEYLVNNLLWNSWYLPLVLTAIGLLFIGLAIYYSTHGGIPKPQASATQEEGEDPIEMEKLRNVYSVNEGNIAYPVIFTAPGQVPMTVVPYPVAINATEEP